MCEKKHYSGNVPSSKYSLNIEIENSGNGPDLRESGIYDHH